MGVWVRCRSRSGFRDLEIGGRKPSRIKVRSSNGRTGHVVFALAGGACCFAIEGEVQATLNGISPERIDLRPGDDLAVCGIHFSITEQPEAVSNEPPTAPTPAPPPKPTLPAASSPSSPPAPAVSVSGSGITNCSHCQAAFTDHDRVNGWKDGRFSICAQCWGRGVRPQNLRDWMSDLEVELGNGSPHAEDAAETDPFDVVPTVAVRRAPEPVPATEPYEPQPVARTPMVGEREPETEPVAAPPPLASPPPAPPPTTVPAPTADVPAASASPALPPAVGDPGPATDPLGTATDPLATDPSDGVVDPAAVTPVTSEDLEAAEDSLSHDNGPQRSSRRLSASRVSSIDGGPTTASGRRRSILGKVTKALLGRNDGDLRHLRELEGERSELLQRAGRVALEQHGGIGLPPDVLGRLAQGRAVTLREADLGQPELHRFRERAKRLALLDAEIEALRRSMALGQDEPALAGTEEPAPLLRQEQQAQEENAFSAMDGMRTEDLGDVAPLPPAPEAALTGNGNGSPVSGRRVSRRRRR